MAYEDNNKPYDNNKAYVRETVRTTDTGSSSTPLIVGGLVVAVAFILWLILGSTGPVSTTAPATVPASDTTNVTVETPAAPADNTTNTTIDPAPEATAPAPDAPVAPAPDAPATDAPATGTPAAPATNP